MYEFPDGRTVGLISSSDVIMTAESVLIAPVDGLRNTWPEEYGWLPLMEVDCMFRLLNASDSVLNVTVGFPFDARYGDSYSVLSDSELVAMLDSMHGAGEIPDWTEEWSSKYESNPEIPEDLDFIAIADGDTLEVFYRQCARDLTNELILRPVVAVWRMQFQPGQEIRLLNSYTTSWDYRGYGMDAHYSISYIVTSGATWAQSIGSAVIRLVVPEELPVPQMNDTLLVSWDWKGSPDVDLTARTLTWEFSDWEPEENLTFRVNTLVDAGIEWQHLSAPRMYEALVWTSDSLLSSAQVFVNSELGWNAPFHAELLLHLAEAVLYIANGMSPPDPLILRYFTNYDLEQYAVEMQPEDLEKLEVTREVSERLMADMDLVQDAGYSSFLPMFRHKWKWDEDLSGMWATHPESSDIFAELLHARLGIEDGVLPDEPAVAAFFRLTAAALHLSDTSCASSSGGD